MAMISAMHKRLPRFLLSRFLWMEEFMDTWALVSKITKKRFSAIDFSQGKIRIAESLLSGYNSTLISVSKGLWISSRIEASVSLWAPKILP